MTVLIILNDAPYGSERFYNGLRLATAPLRHEGTDVRVFLVADAVGCAKSGQKVAAGYYNEPEAPGKAFAAVYRGGRPRCAIHMRPDQAGSES